jgi:hypothetical protein
MQPYAEGFNSGVKGLIVCRPEKNALRFATAAHFIDMFLGIHAEIHSDLHLLQTQFILMRKPSTGMSGVARFLVYVRTMD